MSAISLKSITGITSITTPAGVDDQLTLHNNNTTERVKIDVAGNVHINNQLAVAGVSTFNNDVTLTGVGGNTPDSAIWDYSDKSLNIGNSAFLKFGSTTYSSGQQLQIYQSGSVGIYRI